MVDIIYTRHLIKFIQTRFDATPISCHSDANIDISYVLLVYTIYTVSIYSICGSHSMGKFYSREDNMMQLEYANASLNLIYL